MIGNAMKQAPFIRCRLPASAVIALGYLLLGGLWISFSDKLLLIFVPESETLSVLQTFKGSFFVLSTALLLYLVLKHLHHRNWDTHVELAQSEERFRLVFERANDGIVILGDKLDFIKCNEACCRIFGVDSPEELIGKTPFDFSPEIQRDGRSTAEYSKDITGKLQGDQQLRFEWRLVQPSGKMVDTEISCILFKIGDQSFQQAIIRDVTDRYIREAMRRRENQQTRTLLELYENSKTLTDKELYDFVLDHAVALTGSEIGFMHQVSEDQKTIHLTTWKGASMESCMTAEESHSPLADAGNWVDCVHAKHPVIYNDYPNSPSQKGLPVGHVPLTRFMSIPLMEDDKVRVIFGVGNKEEEYDEQDSIQLQLVMNALHEILSERRLNEQLKKKQASLSEAQRIAHIGSWVHTIAAGTIECSEEVFHIYGVDSETFTPTLDSFMAMVHPDDKERVINAYMDSLKNRTIHEVDHRIILQTGSIRYVHERCEHHYDGDGYPVRSVGTVQDITEQKHAEDELRKARKELQLIIDNSRDVIFQIDLTGNYIYANAAAEGMTGYSVDQLMAMNMTELIVPEHIPMVMERLKKRVAGDYEPGHYSFQIINKNGHRLWVELMTSGVYDEKDQLFAVQGIARDVTDRKRMEEALEKRIVALTRPIEDVEDIAVEDLFDLDELQRIQDEFSAATNVSIVFARPDGTPITQPSNVTRLYFDIIRKTEKGFGNGVASDAALGRYNPEGPTIRPCLNGGIWDAGTPISVEGKHVATCLIGQVRNETQTEEQMRAYAREIGADEEELVKAFYDVPVMSSEQFEKIAKSLQTLATQLSKSAYMNLQQARFIADERARTKELHRLSTAINQMGEMVVITDIGGNIEYVNPAFESVSGYSRDEVLGENPRLLKSGIHSKMFYKNMWECISSGNPWSGQMHNRRKNGTIYIEDAIVSPVCDAQGNIVNYVGVKRDVTKLIKLEEQFQQSQKMEAVGRLASGVAHDFNNILQGILGYCSVLLMETEGQELIQQDVKEIRNTARRAGDLTRQLLAFSRKQPMMQTQLDLNQIMAEQISMLRRLVGEKFSLKFDPSRDLSPIKADRSQIEQVVMNLVVNARDAMPDGGCVTIATKYASFALNEKGERSHAGDFVCLSVADAGTGMEQKVIEHLFEPFFTTKPLGQGTGLGLAVSYGIVEQHGGWIEVESEIGEGSTFSVYLPVCSGEIVPEVPETEVNAPQVARGDHHKRVMVVEDDSQVRSLARLILEQAGYDVIDVMSASLATEVFGANGGIFDLLLIDAVLPDGSGVQLADTLRKMASSAAVVIFSAYGEERIRADEITKRGYIFLKKPFAAETLLATAQSAIEMIK